MNNQELKEKIGKLIHFNKDYTMKEIEEMTSKYGQGYCQAILDVLALFNEEEEE